MTVAELRKLLEGVPEEIEVLKTPTPYDTINPVDTYTAEIEMTKKAESKDVKLYFVIS